MLSVSFLQLTVSFPLVHGEIAPLCVQRNACPLIASVRHGDGELLHSRWTVASLVMAGCLDRAGEIP